MAREARKESLTGYYHVMMRGNNKEMIFSKAIEKQYFTEQLQQQIEKGLISLVAYCIMDNHVHLLIHAKLHMMSETLKFINTKFAGRYNFKYDRVGHVFEDRYKSEAINTEEYLVQVIRYIHNNPLKAKMIYSPNDYQWSSYNCYINCEGALISSEEKDKVISLFSDSLNQFEEFHLQGKEIIETIEFLEMKEDLEHERDENAQKIINTHCEKNGITDVKDLNTRKEILEEIIIELKEKCHLPYSRISKVTNINKCTIHNIVKKFK